MHAIPSDVKSSRHAADVHATAPAHSLDVILVDDTSRLSRKLADSLRIFDQLRFAGVRLIFVSQGIDTDSEQAEVLMATHGIVDSLYIRELAKKTHRGVEGRALQGFHTGGRCFGYRSTPIEDPTRTDNYGRPQILGVKLEVHPEQAAVVRRIFADYAAGDSLKPSPRGSMLKALPLRLRIAARAIHHGRHLRSRSCCTTTATAELSCGTVRKRCAIRRPAGAFSACAREPNGRSLTHLTSESYRTTFGALLKTDCSRCLRHSRMATPRLCARGPTPRATCFRVF